MVSEDKQIFHCFGCGVGGDIIKFLMSVENIEFIEALKILAKKANVELEFEKNKNFGNQKLRKDVLHEILNLSAQYYNYLLTTKEQGKNSLEYLIKRGLDNETIKKFKLGYSPNSWDSLFNFLKSRKYNEEDIFLAGLILKKNTGGYYDRFRNRVMYPIFDINDNVVGFSARILTDNKNEPKYINSPQTEVYNKSNILFGLNFAKQSIKKNGFSIVVEGNMDCISSHKIGVDNVVASSGTALTEQQVKILKRFSNTICFSFDEDLAGKNATERGVDIALENEINLKVISLKNTKYKDPDECIKSNPEDWKDAIKNAQPYLDFYFENLKDKYIEKKLTPNELSVLINPFIEKLSKIKSAVEKSLWIKNISKLTSISEDDLRKELSRIENKNYKKLQNNYTNEVVKKEVIKIETDSILESEEFVIAIMLNNNKYIPLLEKIDLNIFEHKKVRDIASNMLECYNNKIEHITNYIFANDKNSEYINYLLMLGEKIFSDQIFSSVNLIKKDIKNNIIKLYKNLINNELKELKYKIKIAEEKNNLEEIKFLEEALIKKMSELKKTG